MTKEKIIENANWIQGWMTIEELELLYDLSQSVLGKNSLAVKADSF